MCRSRPAGATVRGPFATVHKIDNTIIVKSVSRAPRAEIGEAATAATATDARRCDMARPKASDLALRRLGRAIESVASRPEECARSPGRDFTRRRKLPLDEVLWTEVTWGEDTIGVEMHRRFGWDARAPSPSAFCQRRRRLLPTVFPRLGRAFLDQWPVVPFEGGFRLATVDGTDVQLLPSGDERTRVRSGTGDAEHNEAHPSTLYDIRRGTFEDMEWQGSKEQDEPGAFCKLVDRFDPGTTRGGVRLRALFMGDRNYCSYNTLCHLFGAGASFILRARDDWVEKFLGRDDVPEGEFDVTAERVFVRTSILAARTRPDEPGLYRQIRSTTRLDALPRGGRGEYAMRVRIVRRRIPKRDGDPRGEGDRWLNIVTDLEGPGFRARWLVRTYRRRWGHEVGYRHLKHVVGMRDPRSGDYDLARDEVWGRLILHNVCSLGTAGARGRARRAREHKRKVDLTSAFKAMLAKARGEDADVEAVAGTHTHAVVPGRHFERRKRNRSPPRKQYRH